MIAAQYEILLPTDCNMDIIRRRVAERGSALDERAGLGLKAYLIRDVAESSPVNAYAPFHFWQDPPPWRPSTGVHKDSPASSDFGRPFGHTWIGGGFARGDAFPQIPTYALRRVRYLAPTIDPVDAAIAVDRSGGLHGTDAGVHSSAWGIKPTTRQSVEVTLFTYRPDDDEVAETTAYRVLHLSAPGLQESR